MFALGAKPVLIHCQGATTDKHSCTTTRINHCKTKFMEMPEKLYFSKHKNRKSYYVLLCPSL